MQPKRPATLPELAEATLDALSREPLSANVVLGGGIALKHYDDFRQTQDVDAWWRDAPDSATRATIGAVLTRVAAAQGLRLEHRQFGTTDSWEFTPVGSSRKIFSFQIAVRDVPLDEPLVSPWPPLLIETLRDNIGSKMNALVNRGAPRDFVDVYRVVNDGLISPDACWALWREKNEAGNVKDAQSKVLTHLTRLEQRRPLETIAAPEEQENARALRRWYKETFLEQTKETT
jgi:hypothetical protein